MVLEMEDVFMDHKTLKDVKKHIVDYYYNEIIEYIGKKDFTGDYELEYKKIRNRIIVNNISRPELIWHTPHALKAGDSGIDDICYLR